eukprot:scaffold974_cov368-Prasinococcus_capsulatus_cf.AAC.1
MTTTDESRAAEAEAVGRSLRTGRPDTRRSAPRRRAAQPSSRVQGSARARRRGSEQPPEGGREGGAARPLPLPLSHHAGGDPRTEGARQVASSRTRSPSSASPLGRVQSPPTAWPVSPRR